MMTAATFCSITDRVDLYSSEAGTVSLAKSQLGDALTYGNFRLLVESWMLPNEWVNKMGGETCDDCSTCASTELYVLSSTHPSTRSNFDRSELVKKIGQEKADKVFEEHW